VKKPSAVRRAKPRIGDVLYGKDLLGRVEVPVGDIEGRRLVTPESWRGFAGLASIGVDAREAGQVTYECPWTGNTYYWTRSAS